MRAASLLGLALLAGAAAADTLALRDGRFVDRPRIERNDDGAYVLHYDHGDVIVPPEMVLACYREGGAPVYTPRTEREKRRYAKGYVHWQGRWIRLSQWERLIEKERAARRRALEQLKERRHWRNHAVVKSRRFEFHHNLPDEVFEEFRTLFETYYDFFLKYWRIRPDPKFGKVTINIYHDRAYFEQVSGAPNGVLGWYMPHKRDLHFYYDREHKRMTLDVMFHEGNHMLAHMIDKDMWYPWWIGEGMAEYFGASEWDPETKTMKLGRIQSGRLAVLWSEIREDRWVKLKDLLESQGMGAVGYAWTWSFCHFLLHTPKYEKRFKRYFVAIGRDSSIPRVPRFLTIKQLSPEVARTSFMRYLRVRDLDAMEQEWYAYIREKLSLEGREIDWAEAGLMMKRLGERAQARKFLKRAIDAGSKLAWVHYEYAALKLAQNMPKTARKYAEKATEYDPLHARAWALRGQALYALKEFEEGLRLLELAYEVDPDDPEIWLELETVREMERRRKAAEAEGGPQGG